MRIKLQFGLAIIAFMALLVPNAAQAALTVGSTTITSDAALTLTGAAASAVALGTTATTGNLTVGTALTTGAVTIGGVAQTGAITLGASTQSQAINIGYGSTIAAGQTQTIRIGGNGASTSTSNIYIGTQPSGAGDVVVDIAGSSSDTTGSTSINIGNNTSGRTTLTLGNTASTSSTFIQARTSTAGYGIKLTGRLSHAYTDAPISFSADRTITAQEMMVNRIFVHPSSDDNARVITTDNGTNIKAAMPGQGAGQYDVFTFLVANQAATGSSVITFIGGANVTIDANVTVPAKTSRVIYCQAGTGNSVTCY
jgi:hypothetical protein